MGDSLKIVGFFSSLKNNVSIRKSFGYKDSLTWLSKNILQYERIKNKIITFLRFIREQKDV